MSKSLQIPYGIEVIIAKDNINSIFNSHTDLVQKSLNLFGDGIVEWLNIIDLFQN